MKCFYHNDLDGHLSAAIVAHTIGDYDEENYIELDHIKEFPIDIVKPHEIVYIVDYSFTKDTWHYLLEMAQMGCNIHWIDHHTSSIELLNDNNFVDAMHKYEYFITYIFSSIGGNNTAACALTWLYFNYDKKYDDVPYFIKLISDYDSWSYVLDPDTTLFKIGMDAEDDSALSSVWSNLFNEYAKLDLNRPVLNRIINKGKVIKGYIDETNAYYRENFAYETEIDGHKCIVVNQKTNSWVFGDEYYNYPLVCVWVFNGEKFIYSIFSSDKSINCAKIAESYGGGGHYSAAGFISDQLLFKGKKVF